MATNKEAPQAPAIADNTFYKILFDSASTTTYAEKVAAVAKALTFDAKHATEFELCTDYLQSEHKNFRLALVALSDSSAIGLLGEVYTTTKEFGNRINKITDDFLKQSKRKAGGAVQNGDQELLLKEAQGLLAVAKKVTSERLPRLAEEKEHIDALRDVNQGLINAYSALSEGAVQASALNGYAADIAAVQKDLQQQSDKLKMLEKINCDQIAQVRKLAGKMADQVVSVFGKGLTAAADFNKAGAPASIVLPQEVQEIVAVLKEASAEEKQTRPRPAGP